GDPKKRRSFVRFSEALSLFAEQEEEQQEQQEEQQEESTFSRVFNLFRRDEPQEESTFSRVPNLQRRDDEPRRIFLAAIKSHVAHGAILLTGVD
ncbi:unnamed protein product, partial [Ectocarpus fasciculatus]